jgi:tetratricopeptide (TPR) repeat protein
LTIFRHCFAAALSTIFAIGCSSARPGPAPYAPTPEETEWERCRAFEKQADFDKADACLSEMCGENPPYVRACYDRSRMLFEIDRGDSAREAAAEFIESFPDDALAPTAVKRLGRSYADKEEWEQGFSMFEKLEKSTKGTEVCDSVLYTYAELLGKAGRVAEEAKVLERLVRSHGRWNSQLWDDAMWRLINIYRKREDFQAETSALRRFLKTRKKSYLIGSYNSSYYDDALLRMGYIALEKKDYEEACELFNELGGSETSRLRDEGRIGAAEVEIELGNRLEACGLLKKVIEMSAASSRRRAEKLSKSLGCP